MKKNVGSYDRIIRIGIAAAAAYLVISETVALSSFPGIALTVVAGIMLVTSIAGTCPIYSIVGLSTCPVDTKKA